MRFGAAPHPVAQLETHEVSRLRTIGAVFEVCELSLMHRYAIRPVCGVDENIIWLDI